MEYYYHAAGVNRPTIIALHGTGGDQYSLLPALEGLKDSFNILSLRGRVNEGGMLRFFKRLGEGIYDLASMDQERDHLRETILEAASHHGFSLDKTILFGFSNGANMGLHLFFQDPHLFQYGIFMAPLYPLPIDQTQDWSQKQAFVSMGQADPLCSMDQNQALLAQFKDLNLPIDLVWVKHHELTYPVLTAYTNWLQSLPL